MKNKRWIGWTLAAALPLLMGCQTAEEPEETIEAPTPMEETAAEETPMDATRPATAGAELKGPDGSDMGVVTFTQEADGVHVVARVDGIETPGLHGFHIHETGDCSAGDFTSAGGHFNPEGVAHACPPDTPRHAGDFGNIEIGEDGVGNLDETSDLVTLQRGSTSILGKAVIVHGGEDDCASDPTGNAGDRLACGVIQAAPANVQSETDEPAVGGDDEY